MAPAGDSAYFPPLDKCLTGDQRLLTWSQVYVALCDAEAALQSTGLPLFLSDETSTAILGRPLEPFPTATPQSKTDFETKTAAIHVTPSSNGHYNIDEIKEDALWLSKETNTDEASALRIVIVEWQTRPAAQLLSGLTEEETLSVQDAAGGASFGASMSFLKSSILATPAGPSRTDSMIFSSPEQRRARLLELYLSERSHILRVSEILVRQSIDADRVNESDAGKGKRQESDTWLEDLGRKIATSQSAGKGFSFASQCIEAFRGRLAGLEAGCKWDAAEDNPELGALWGIAQVVEIIHILQLLFVHLDCAPGLPPSRIVLEWFKLAAQYAFFREMQFAIPSQQAMVPLFQNMVAIVSLRIIQLPKALELLLPSSTPDEPPASRLDARPYLSDLECIGEVNAILVQAATSEPSPAIPVVFAWAIILRLLRDLVGEDEIDWTGEESPSTFSRSASRPPNPPPAGAFPVKAAWERMELSADVFHVYDVLANLATNMVHSFAASIDLSFERRARAAFLELLRASLSYASYASAVVASSIAILSEDRSYWDYLDKSISDTPDSVIETFLRDEEILIPSLLAQAQHRFPYETMPFLTYLRILAIYGETDDDGVLRVTRMLENNPEFTQKMPQHFVGYETIREEEDANWVSLTQDLPVFVSQRSRKAITRTSNALSPILVHDEAEDFIIPSGTPGYVMSNTKPPVTSWSFLHSSLQYLSRLLTTAIIGVDRVETASQTRVGLDTASDIVGLFATLFTASIRSAKASNGAFELTSAAQQILEQASDDVGHNQDIVTIVFDLFEQSLQRQRQQPGLGENLDLIVSCVQFMRALTAVLPNRVWPLLARSALLDIEGSGGSLLAIVAGTEIVAGRYDFLISCIRLFEALVDNAVTKTVVRKGISQALTRFGSSANSGSGSSERVMSRILLTFEKMLMGVFESSLGWRFIVAEEKMEISARLAGAFDRLLKYAYGCDDTQPVSQKLVGVLASPAEYLIESFLSGSSNDLPTHPIVNILSVGISTPRTTLFAKNAKLWTAQTRATIFLSITLLRVSVLLDRSNSHLETQLFKACPLLARLYATHESYRAPVVQLLEVLVKAAGRSDGEPASLLGHLGPATAKSFLSMLSDLGRPLNDESIEIDIWHLLSAVVSNKQQWFAIYLLTGSTPRDTLKRKETEGSSKAHGKPLLTYALDQLSNLERLEPQLATGMLEFVALGLDHWPWTMNHIRSHPHFLTSMMDFLGGLKDDSHSSVEQSIDKAHQNHKASLIASILAMYLHNARQIGDVSIAKKLVPKLSYMSGRGVSVPEYNSSLHANLKKNFETKFPGCRLADFKHSSLVRTRFGRNYYYDIGFASELLGHDQAWSNGRNQGFEEEFVRANVNLSLVQSQVLLLKSWKALASELSTIISEVPELSKLLAKVVGDCLKANTASNLSESLFDRLVYTRLDLAFVLLQKLVTAKSTEDETKAILPIAWEIMRKSGQDFELAFVGENADYYRALTKILFLSLQPHISDSTPPTGSDSAKSTRTKPSANDASSIVPMLLEILSKVVAQGFRSLATQVHEDERSCSPSDFVLLTALLQSVLRVPGMRTFHSQIALQFSATNTSRYATSLFSWSDQLAIDRDPVYGELSILFLLELSSMEVMAENLAVDGVLAQLSTANLVKYFQRPNGMGPFDEPARLFSIWTRGILPLCLNLLLAVQAPVAAEVAAFLNQFPNQLARAAADLSGKPPPSRKGSHTGHITLGMASETHSLALIALVIEQMRAAPGVAASEIPPLRWDKAGVKEDVEGWLQGRRGLRDRITPTNEREVELQRMRPVDEKVLAENRLEERVVVELMGALECLNGGNGGV
ncbi:hypothetical protein H2199_006822 [Coniosporium tulheliwenetii]|uniref:Uncharacterized protein n=1 Tax=Coniosporium tulheliwenetii TaxID=3383036 RepID=A0ACC2YUI8_9PEZI|nr:hypothetical protein H2199_006822 [Cladosporium sp. JES 115]